jgi:putative oxidoreductase
LAGKRDATAAGGVLHVEWRRAEAVGGLLVLFGLLTRPIAFLLAGEMAVAYWMFHAPQGPFPMNNGGDASILFCFALLFLAAAGPGRFALDNSRSRTARID